MRSCGSRSNRCSRARWTSVPLVAADDGRLGQLVDRREAERQRAVLERRDLGRREGAGRREGHGRTVPGGADSGAGPGPPQHAVRSHGGRSDRRPAGSQRRLLRGVRGAGSRRACPRRGCTRTTSSAPIRAGRRSGAGRPSPPPGSRCSRATTPCSSSSPTSRPRCAATSGGSASTRTSSPAPRRRSVAAMNLFERVEGRWRLVVHLGSGHRCGLTVLACPVRSGSDRARHLR